MRTGSKWRRRGFLSSQPRSWGICSRHHLRWNFPSYITEWNVSESLIGIFYIWHCHFLFSVFLENAASGERSGYLLLISLQKTGGEKLTINFFWQVLEDGVSQRAREIKIRLLWNKTGKPGMRSTEADSVLTLESECWTVSPSWWNWTGIPPPIFEWKSGKQNQDEHQMWPAPLPPRCQVTSE